MKKFLIAGAAIAAMALVPATASASQYQRTCSDGHWYVEKLQVYKQFPTTSCSGRRRS